MTDKNYNDYNMMDFCISPKISSLFSSLGCEQHPLDKDVVLEIKNLMEAMASNNKEDVYEIFHHIEKIDAIWSLLLEKAIKCLRYYDPREPFEENKEKNPQAYGLSELNEYYKKYKKFESMLYGSSQFYRDHVIHVFRTWLSGVKCMVSDGGKYLKYISIHDEEKVDLNSQEKLSIWTIIALTHDLGYPLEKAKDIIEATHAMISSFVTSPTISMDLSFHGVQNYMNDFIVRLMSSKMKKVGSKKNNNNKKTSLYVARPQPKYYFKFQKSLERMKHGILSTLIIYKLLAYFLDSDYSINEDYKFDEDERKQFYIRREILRAIATHTCKDVFHLHMGSFAFLLIVSDDTQEWGRKYLSELYTPSGNEHTLEEIQLIVNKNKCNECNIKENIVITKKRIDDVTNLLKRLREQALNYVRIFRDGHDTKNRDFSFTKNLTIKYGKSPEITLDMSLKILNDAVSSLEGNIKCQEVQKNQKFFEEFVEAIKKANVGKIKPQEEYSGEEKTLIDCAIVMDLVK